MDIEEAGIRTAYRPYYPQTDQVVSQKLKKRGTICLPSRQLPNKDKINKLRSLETAGGDRL